MISYQLLIESHQSLPIFSLPVITIIIDIKKHWHHVMAKQKTLASKTSN
jgi:hypothetical protein